MTAPASVSPDLLIVLLSPRATFDERKAAVSEVVAAAWSEGWDAALQEVTAAMLTADKLIDFDIAVEKLRARTRHG